jgi:hypothetical protein
VPAARGETSEQRVTRGRLVEVERLRIELPGEGFDLLLVDQVSIGLESLSGMEVLEIVRGHSPVHHAITFKPKDLIVAADRPESRFAAI